MQGNIVVLAKATFQVAPRKKHRAATHIAGNTRFFPKVLRYTRKLDASCAAKPRAHRPIDIAISWTKITFHPRIIPQRILFGKYQQCNCAFFTNTYKYFLATACALRQASLSNKSTAITTGRSNTHKALGIYTPQRLDYTTKNSATNPISNTALNLHCP